MKRGEFLRGITGLVLVLLLALVLGVSAYGAEPAVVASGTCGANGDNITWTLDDAGTLTISGTGEMKNYGFGSSAAPWKSYETMLKSVVIGEGVTNIGDNAFIRCSGLASVTIGNSVTSIGEYAFYDCRALTNVTIPDSATSNGESAFGDCRSLTSVTIPDGVAEIRKGTFYWCIGLTSVTIPNSVASIGRTAFDGCSSLTDVCFNGTKTQWSKIEVGESNDPLQSAAVHYRPAAPVVMADYQVPTGKPYLQWRGVEGANKYYVYRSATESGGYAYLNSTTGLSYTDNSAQAGQTYFYKVRAAWDDKLTGSYSAAVAAGCHCIAPKVKASYVGDTGKPYLHWNSVEGAASYYVYRATGKNGAYQYLDSTTKTNYTDTAAAAGTSYYYKIKAVPDSGLASGFSTEAMVTCRCVKPEVKASYVASSGKPHVKWSAVAGANRYEVYRAGKDGTYRYLDYTIDAGYTDAAAVTGETYLYRVKAISEVKHIASSDQSAAVAITCRCPKPVVKPSYVGASGKPYVYWSAVDGEAKYEVYRSASADGTYSRIGTTTKLNYTDTTAEAGTTYYYKVRAVSSVKSTANSAYSAVKSIKAK